MARSRHTWSPSKADSREQSGLRSNTHWSRRAHGPCYPVAAARGSAQALGGLDEPREEPVPDLLIEQWRQAAADLGLAIEAPFLLQLQDGRIEARLLLRNFGAANGMLIVTDFSVVRPFVDEVDAGGYGFSTLSEPSSRAAYDRDTFVEMLCDWGWSGPEQERPVWCVVADADSDQAD
jgi:hypothetical protein